MSAVNPAELAPRESAADRIEASLREGAAFRYILARTGVESIARAGSLIVDCLRNGGKLLLCGNGGSAADCQHIAAELTGRFGPASRPGLAALALTTDTSTLTAIANDFGYDAVFARQVDAIGRADDVLLAISTSGRSANVIAAAESAKDRGISVVVLTGSAPGPLAALADVVISVPGTSTARVQELHAAVGHILCELVEGEVSK